MGTIANLNLSTKVTAFLAKGPLRSLIGGEWAASANESTFSTLDPGSGEVIATVFLMQESDVDSAVAAAARAFRSSGWATMDPDKRGECLLRWASAVARNRDFLAELNALDCGKIPTQSMGEIDNFSVLMSYYVDQASRIQYSEHIPVSGFNARSVRFPAGVCGFIFPWNFPINLLAYGIAPALAAGNTVVVKPSADSPLATLAIAELAADAGIPAGVFNVVAGTAEPTGRALAAHPGLQRFSLTGSTAAGKSVASACAANLVPVKLELGGKGAAIVFDDVDIYQAATDLCNIISFHAGQVCCTASRWFVQRRILSDFLAAGKARMGSISVGHGFDPGTEMGAVINAKQRDRILSYINQGVAEGAELLVGGGSCSVSRWPEGFYVQPTLLVGRPDNIVSREEVFGPVAYITPFETEDEAIALVNDTPYGLANSVWSKDPKRCDRVAELMVSGNSWINAHNIFPLGVPYAGIKQSGIGSGVNGQDTILDYLRHLSIAGPQ
jgi:acyl-CoA reductase-like NAD-dependent aldehyde dehydrogenase